MYVLWSHCEIEEGQGRFVWLGRKPRAPVRRLKSALFSAFQMTYWAAQLFTFSCTDNLQEDKALASQACDSF